jgi:hypothetical protein
MILRSLVLAAGAGKGGAFLLHCRRAAREHADIQIARVVPIRLYSIHDRLSDATASVLIQDEPETGTGFSHKMSLEGGIGFRARSTAGYPPAT